MAYLGPWLLSEDRCWSLYYPAFRRWFKAQGCSSASVRRFGIVA
ncbi:hypothetical protein FOQG_19347 [Fusarium oxysporum f. sp. raphani 54005]|uniref:Uncharacterized protein n=2 Tax=Fusarium oxysporum TaxID=5507 RepID=X0BBK9_FUSOX|nr:hypothetical protein FOQG_19347 [Fusarium oxysporum f. sp. raphani 54005]EXL63879.1 hypothetical protein FOPG_19849 [Fusarium oxysporum f. sp. conglutinans race 2 54008]